MKRHPSLAPLSRDHHGALILARLLQSGAPVYKGLPADAEGKANYAVKFYKENLIKHFEEEEKIFQLVTGNNEALDLLVKTILNEHKQLHVLFKSINNHSNLPLHLHQLGKALEAHIRKEERELFTLMQESCSENILTVIGTSLSSH